MTETTTPTPPEGLTDERLLELAAAAIDGYDSIAPGEYEGSTYCALEVYGSELLAAMRAAIAADRAARHQHPEEDEGRRWTEGICGNGAAILFDGAMVPIEEVVRALNSADRAARPTPAPVPTFLDAIRLANGCHDYSGGYGGAEGEAWHAGIGTVVTVLRRAAAGPWDSQVTAVFAMGADTPAPTPEELEAQFRAWWKASYPSAPAGGHAVASHVAFGQHLLGRGVTP